MAVFGVSSRPSHSGVRLGLLLAAVSVTALQAGCASLDATDVAQLAPSSAEVAEQGNSASPSIAALKANYENAPENAAHAVAYASALKQLGAKEEAYSVLKSAVKQNESDRAVLSEYGRLALEFNDVAVAKDALARADDPEHPDWRIVMARGTVLAKEGHYQLALPYFERAFSLEPRHPSVQSNLALAYTMTGQPEKGEPLLRNAIANGSSDPRLKQNLALVLKVQNKSDAPSSEVTAVAAPQAAQSAQSEALNQSDTSHQGAEPGPASAITTSSIGRISSGETSSLPPISTESSGAN